MTKKTLNDVIVSNKTVLLRVDFNVPITDGEITDDTRIVAALDTIKHLIKNDARTVVFAHRGRIKKNEDKKMNSLLPVVKRLSERLGQEVVFSKETRGKKLEEKVHELNNGDVLLVENTRFEDVDNETGERVRLESNNDPELSKYWASLGDLFINDAFGTAHREHASNAGIASHLESAVGFLVEKELDILGKAIDQPERPFVVIMGGAKVSDKISIIQNLLPKADKMIIGGGMAYTFLRAQGKEVGLSLLDTDRIDYAKGLLNEYGDKIVLPIDIKVADDFNNEANIQIVSTDDIPIDWEGLDCGPKTIELFKETLKNAKTVIWNGPMGVFEFPEFAKGTEGVAQAIAELDDVVSIVGGGDSAAAVRQLGLEDQFTHISTGGGASLGYLEGSELVGLTPIDELEK